MKHKDNDIMCMQAGHRLRCLDAGRAGAQHRLLDMACRAGTGRAGRAGMQRL